MHGHLAKATFFKLMWSCVGICGYWETLCPVYVHFFLTPTWYFYNSKPCFWILELVNVLSMHSGFIQNIHQFSYAKIFEGR